MPPLTTTELINGSTRSPRTDVAQSGPSGRPMTKPTEEGVEVGLDLVEVRKADAPPLTAAEMLEYAHPNNSHGAAAPAAVGSTNDIAEAADNTFHTAQQQQQEQDQAGAVASNYPMQLHRHPDSGNVVQGDGHDRGSSHNLDYVYSQSYGGLPPDMHMPVPPVRQQRRRSSLGHTACTEIGEAAAEHLQTFLETTQLERTDSGNARRYSRDDADELARLKEEEDNAMRSDDRGGAVVDDPARVAPERSQTASPTLPGQTQASYKQYIDLYPGGTTGRVERSASLTSTGSRRRSNGSSAGSARSLNSDGNSHSHSQSNAGPEARCYLPVRTFHMDEIVVGRLLGTGTFNDVYEAFLVPRQRPVYGRQASLPSSLGRERRAQQVGASGGGAGGGATNNTAATTDRLHASFPNDLCADLDVDRQEQAQQQAQAQDQAQDAPSAAPCQPTYGQMALNDESAPPSRAIRFRPPSTTGPASHPPSGPRYVLKHLKDVVMEDYDTFLTGAVDLAVEAKMLSHLHHPNIIRLEGVTAGSLSDALSTGIVGGYFLVLEMLEISLLDQIVKWAEEKRASKKGKRPSFTHLVRTLSSKSLNDSDSKLGGNANGASATGHGGDDGGALSPRRMPRRRSSGASSSFRSFFDSEEDQSTAAAPPPSRPAKEPMFLYHRRLTVAAEIAAGFAYLHRKNILYRDAKPQNIGLDHNGTVKIFDMGLAKELHEGDKRKHTGNCGTKRYMSPECGRFEHYGLSSDVYAFSLLLWEILAMERPYAKLTAKDFSEKVYFGSMRPTIPSKWPRAIRELLPDCWTNEKNERPTMETVANVLRNMAEEAKPFAATAANTSSRSLNDGMSDITSVASEAPSHQGAVAGGKARPGMLRRPSMTRGSFRLGGSSRSLAGGPSKVSSEGVVVPKNIRKWLEEQEKKESKLDSETLRVARTGGARAAARRNSINIDKRPEGDSIEQQDSFQDSQELHDPLAKSTGDNDRRVSYGSASTGSNNNPAADPGAATHLRRGSDQSSTSVGAVMFPARSISRRASTWYF